MKLLSVNSFTMDGMPAMAIEKSSDMVWIGACTSSPSGYAAGSTGMSATACSRKCTYS